MNTSKVIFIPKGSVTKIISHLNQDSGKLSKIDTYLLRFFGEPQHGWIDLGSTTMNHGEYLYAITHSKAAMKEITLIPGETTYIFFKIVAKEFELEHTELTKELKRQSDLQEGIFVPDTYKIPLGIDEKGIVKLLLDRSKSKMREYRQKLQGEFDEKQWLRLVTYASIIQKESGSIEEMPTVSSVIANRLKKGMKLQMDGSLNYGKYSHIKITARRLREDKSLYNTYLYSGLPPYPVCNVSFEALQAALNPIKSNYIYFVKGKDGKHKFSRYYSTHIQNINDATK